MLTKEQALAMADTMTAPAVAERLRHAERRSARFVWVYPILKQVPVLERTVLLREAHVYATRHWSFIIAAAAVLLAGSYPFVSRAVGGALPSVKIDMPFVQLALGALFLLQHLNSRRFLKAEVPTRFPAGDSTNVISDA